MWWDPGTHISAVKRGSRGCTCKIFLSLFCLKERKMGRKKGKGKKRELWFGNGHFYFWCLASLLLLGVYFFTGTYTGTRLTPPHPFGLYQPSVELGLLPTIRNKSVNLGVLKLTWSDCSVLPVKTKPWWHHIHSYMSLLKIFVSTFTAWLLHFCLWILCASQWLCCN